jgi:hypothetical protein
MMNYRKSFTNTPNLRQGLISGLTILGIVSGWAPQWLNKTEPSRWSRAAIAQTQVSEEQVRRYAKAVLEIERIRQTAYAQTQKIMGDNLPREVCRQNSLPSEVRDICDRFLKDSAAIIKRHGLTGTEFNGITQEVRNNSSLDGRVKAELLRLQQSQEQ